MKLIIEINVPDGVDLAKAREVFYELVDIHEVETAIEDILHDED
jgi:hypothetical protein